MADLRDAVLDRLDDLAEQVQPCDPTYDCLHQVVGGLRAAIHFGAEHPGMILLEPVLLARVAEALDVREVSGG